MTSALTVLFLRICASPSHSCLCVNTEIIWPSPAIYLSPGRVIAPGEAVTIRCQCWCWSRRLFLYKDGSQVQELTVDGGGGEFIIPSAQREDEGVYSCRSHSIWDGCSDHIGVCLTACLLTAETHYPKPSIWLSPSVGVGLGGAVTFRCRGRHQNMRFLLYKAGNPAALQDVEPAGNTAKFAIHSAGREDAGSYSCRYRTKVDPPVWSEPSDPVELGVAGEGCPCSHPHTSSASLGVITLGQAVTIRCQCRCRGRRLLLYKDGIRVRELDADEDRSKFPITNVRREDGGVYMCRSRSRLEPPDWSDPSDSMWIIVTTIFLSPFNVAPGGAVTIRCQCQQWGMRILLYKLGDPEVRRWAEPAGNLAEFPIRNASRQDAGSYSCRYSTKSNQPFWSEPSDPVELVVAGEGPGSVSLQWDTEGEGKREKWNNHPPQ
uniref:Ig-like domain-containing protein n=1 Tax=Pelusios castaneus TaxID=367368 RepID=A0A8C8SSE1_9SAUR